MKCVHGEILLVCNEYNPRWLVIGRLDTSVVWTAAWYLTPAKRSSTSSPLMRAPRSNTCVCAFSCICHRKGHVIAGRLATAPYNIGASRKAGAASEAWFTVVLFVVVERRRNKNPIGSPQHCARPSETSTATTKYPTFSIKLDQQDRLGGAKCLRKSAPLTLSTTKSRCWSVLEVGS